MTQTEAAARAAELTKQVYAAPKGAVGCCLHILTDDCNINDDDVQWCLNYAKERGCQLCVETARVYLSLTKHNRAVVLNMGWCPECEDYSCCGVCHDCEGSVKEINLKDPDA